MATLFLLMILSGARPAPHAANPAASQTTQAVRPFGGIVPDMREREYADLRKDLEAAARLMPEAHYEFRPVDTIRTFGGEIAHAAAVNRRLCTRATGNAEPSSSPTRGDGARPKAELVAGLEASFRLCDRAFAGATDQSVLAPTFGPYIRASHLVAMLGHNSVVYGKLAIMLRIKGLVPPSTGISR
jgi:hypothetical protein